jgi:hypothetical protein
MPTKPAWVDPRLGSTQAGLCKGRARTPEMDECMREQGPGSAARIDAAREGGRDDCVARGAVHNEEP